MIDLSKSYEFFDPSKVDGMVHIVGCGSVGSAVAELLIRSGVNKMTLWDFDKVESHNIGNQMFRFKDIGKPKVEALKELLVEVDPDCGDTIKTKPKGWDGQMMSGYIFLAADNMDVRRQIVEQHMDSPHVKAVFDFRTRLESAQHFAADWNNLESRKSLLNSMQFSNEEADEETEVSACGITLGVATTVRVICAYGVSNFINFVNHGGPGLKQMCFADAFEMGAESF